MSTTSSSKPARSSRMWLIYLSLILSGILLIADALNIGFLEQLTIRLGIGLLFSAVALVGGKNGNMGIIATALIWVAIIITFFQ